MALKVFDGFDHYNNEADFLSRSGWLQWQAAPGWFGPANFVTGRDGFGKAIQVSNSGSGNTPQGGIRSVFGARNSEFFYGFAIFLPASTGPTSGIAITLWDSTTTPSPTANLTFVFNANNYAVNVFRGLFSGTLLTMSPNNVWTGDRWQYVELHAKFNGSSGVVDVRVDSVSVFGGPVTGLNTVASGANAWADLADHDPIPISGQGEFFMDDFYYNDTTSGAGVNPFNTFLGDAAVRTVFATGNSSVQWMPLANANWQEISEVAMDSDVSYNFTTTVGQKDLFVFGTLSTSVTTVYAVQITYAARKDDAGARTIKSFVNIAATEYDGTTNSLSSGYSYYTDLWVLNPHTSLNWTVSDVNAAIYGYAMVS